MKKIRVFIADDHEVVIKGIVAILNEAVDMVMVGYTMSGKNLWEQVRAAQADVLLLDVKMEEFDVLTALKQCQSIFPSAKVIIVTAQQDPLHVKAAAERGAAGYLLKEEALSAQLPDAIRTVAAGKMWFSPRASQYLLQGNDKMELLGTYLLEVLRLMVAGETPNAIAATLNKSVAAIYNAQTQIREKLGTNTNEQAIIMAIRERLVPLKG